MFLVWLKYLSANFTYFAFLRLQYFIFHFQTNKIQLSYISEVLLSITSKLKILFIFELQTVNLFLNKWSKRSIIVVTLFLNVKETVPSVLKIFRKTDIYFLVIKCFIPESVKIQVVSTIFSNVKQSVLTICLL